MAEERYSSYAKYPLSQERAMFVTLDASSPSHQLEDKLSS
jgi:hypothetical protein